MLRNIIASSCKYREILHDILLKLGCEVLLVNGALQQMEFSIGKMQMKMMCRFGTISNRVQRLEGKFGVLRIATRDQGPRIGV